MLKADYHRAVALCKASIDGGFDLTTSHTSVESLPYDALQSLRRQMFSRHIRKVDWRCKQRTKEFLTQYRKGSSIIDIARQPGLRYSPYLMARILVGALEPGAAIAQLMRTPSLISDERLRREVEECISDDRDYSPHLDRVRRGVGAEYEFVLQQKLRARGVAFESESDLRQKGAYKTPDMLLQTPMAVKGPRNEWVVVSWIDSKAMFGDEHTYVQEHQSQLLSYVNRYGPGLVIYWFGYVETLVSPEFDGYKKDIMVKADFPSPIMLPDGQVL
ncbi:unnamed protein product [Ectocarpus sp. 6 AP-2014]